MSRLQVEIKQRKPFGSVHTELWLNLSRTSAQITHMIELRLRPHGLSPTQYNVLRILRGSDSFGMVQHEIGDRLVAQVPDIPRILGRMEKAGWIIRTRSQTDRRVVRAALSDVGLTLVNSLDNLMDQASRELFPSMEEDSMRQLCDLLDSARSGRRAP